LKTSKGIELRRKFALQISRRVNSEGTVYRVWSHRRDSLAGVFLYKNKRIKLFKGKITVSEKTDG
jgi:fibrillarin-like rRNA methylase